MESVGDPREGPSTERAFEAEPLPAWTEQITVRSVVVSLLLSTVLSGVSMNLSFTSGIVPSLNISAGLLSLFLLRTWTTLLGRYGVLHQRFTRQENTIIQTCVVACATMANSGGFASNILGMSLKSPEEKKIGQHDVNISEPKLSRLIAFSFLISFVGLFAIVPMRKTMIVRHRLTYPSGTATAHLINSFHTPQGAKQAKKQVSLMLKSFGGSLLWSLIQWFYSAGNNCGFGSFPTFGLQAYQRGFYFNFSGTYVGVGMICPNLINISMLIGSLISSGLLWPYIRTKKGVWYEAKLTETSLSGINAYKVFSCIAMVLGDGLIQILAILFKTMDTMNSKRHTAMAVSKPFMNVDGAPRPALSFDDRRRTQIFLRDKIPRTFAIGGYLTLATVSTFAIPHVYDQIKYQHIAIAYIFAPLLAFCNAYSTGIADLNLSAHYSKLVIVIVGLLIRTECGGVVGSLVICGVMTAIVSTAADVMQDFKTCYLTLTSPRAMFISQVIGTCIGCIINPIIFWIFYNFTKNSNNQLYQAPYAKAFRTVAVFAASGFKKLPKYCIDISISFFVLALTTSALREVAMHKKWFIRRYIPSVIGMSVSFLTIPAVAVDMCVGSLIVLAWKKTDEQSSQLFAPVLASGLICGDGVFAIPYSLLTTYRVQPPICIKFLSRDANAQVDGFLQS